jgi:two-component system, cell cycle response regulator
MPSQVLIVDDVLTNAILLKGMVKRIEGVEPIAFTSAREALAWCETHDPDLVLLDYLMPEMDGVELLQRIRQLPHLTTVPIVVVTGQEDRPSLYKALTAGASDFLIKPVDEVELIARARNMLKLRAATRDLYRLATTDELTGLANRRYFFVRLTEEAKRTQRYGQPLALALLDIDHFKRINDVYGHAAGDEVLETVGRLCRETLRDVDTIGRIGGEEIAVLMPATTLTGAWIVCERLRQAIADADVETSGASVRSTVSIGIAELAQGEEFTRLLARADQALYRAKESGRNRTLTDPDGACGLPGQETPAEHPAPAAA